MQVLTRVREGCVVHRCQNKNPRERLTSGCEWRHAPEAHGGFGEIWKSQLVESSPALEEEGWLSLARGGLGQVSHEIGGGGWWKSQNRKNEYLSPDVEEPLNSKVIKSRKCFRVSRFLCSMYICYEHLMYVSHSRIWLWYTVANNNIWYSLKYESYFGWTLYSEVKFRWT